MNIKDILKLALQEDLSKQGDITSLAIIEEGAKGKAAIIIKDEGVIAGVQVARETFLLVDKTLDFKEHKQDGDRCSYGETIATITGDYRAILAAERVALNCLQRMSGIANLTNKVIDKIKFSDAKILDTRKTTPNIRYLEKLAVVIGGGHNHRFGLYDMMLIKDNHIDFAGSITKAIIKANQYIQENNLSVAIEVETRNLDEIQEVLNVGRVNRIMLDNFDPANLAKGIKLINKQFETEASGNITLDNIVEYAKCNPDYISMGSLTHSVKSIDFSIKYKA
ncbi:MAG: carboxylating nicotinate-nucleotide diphosphorylase [Solitalea-like symbiont of Acarus siro]